MTLEQFIATNNGKYLDWDHAYGYQCVDLIRYYQRDVLNVAPGAIPPADTAALIYKNFPYNHPIFKKIDNTPTGVPQKGDIVFWGAPKGLYWQWGIPKFAGHVAIFSEGNTHTFISFDQNWGSPSFCKYVNHTDNYSGVLGWLHKK